MSETELGTTLATLLQIAWLLPLAGFTIEVFGGFWSSRTSKLPAYLAVGCIGGGFVCSCVAACLWGSATGWEGLRPVHHDAAAHRPPHLPGEDPAGEAAHAPAEHTAVVRAKEHISPSRAFSGTYYTLAKFRHLVVGIDYYIDSLTLAMFLMVTLIATCIHIFAIGYMSDELTEDHVDHEVHLSSGKHLHRPGRFHVFFSYMSLFSFSMLGLVLAGNIFQVFIFWELVGICSYLLIGFYVERHSASTAANKAFVMNRVGDFGFLIGLMILWTACGTFRFADHTIDGKSFPGLFTMVRGESGLLDVDPRTHEVYLQDIGGKRFTYFDAVRNEQREFSISYGLLVAAGLGVFAGCIGKSAQFPLQTWLPDAMEGPTPVSALVHSATMVAAGVYLAGRFFPVFTPEVLLTIAYVGCITLFLAATIAIVATDIKRVLAYSTISQLGYMMLGIGLAGWGAGLFHLITHAFFKSLMFLASGSVIVGCHHVQEMTRMGGLRKKMPVTAYTMLVGVIAISGLAIPVYLPIDWFSEHGEAIAFSGYHSKDAIVATALAHARLNAHWLLFVVPLVTAGITAFYMFRLWFLTFAGQPRDRHLYEHVHESPWVMTGPLVVLALFAAFVAVGGEAGPLFSLLAHSEPVGIADGNLTQVVTRVYLPGHHEVANVHTEAGVLALGVAIAGTVFAYLLYVAGVVAPADIQRQFAGVYRFLREKWQFDALYEVMFVRSVHIVASWCAWIDRQVFDGFLHACARGVVDASTWDRRFDEAIIDGTVNLLADVTYSAGRSLRAVQTGLLRQYVMFIAVGVVAMFLLLFMFFPK